MCLYCPSILSDQYRYLWVCLHVLSISKPPNSIQKWRSFQRSGCSSTLLHVNECGWNYIHIWSIWAIFLYGTGTLRGLSLRTSLLSVHIKFSRFGHRIILTSWMTCMTKSSAFKSLEFTVRGVSLTCVSWLSFLGALQSGHLICGGILSIHCKLDRSYSGMDEGLSSGNLIPRPRTPSPGPTL